MVGCKALHIGSGQAGAPAEGPAFKALRACAFVGASAAAADARLAAASGVAAAGLPPSAVPSNSLGSGLPPVHRSGAVSQAFICHCVAIRPCTEGATSRTFGSKSLNKSSRKAGLGAPAAPASSWLSGTSSDWMASSGGNEACIAPALTGSIASGGFTMYSSGTHWHHYRLSLPLIHCSSWRVTPCMQTCKQAGASSACVGRCASAEEGDVTLALALPVAHAVEEPQAVHEKDLAPAPTQCDYMPSISAYAELEARSSQRPALSCTGVVCMHASAQHSAMRRDACASTRFPQDPAKGEMAALGMP